MVSMLYIIGATMFILLFRGGSLHCLFRYSLCSPFAYVLLFGAFKLIKNVSGSYKFFIFSTLSSICIMILGLADYSTYWNFSDIGVFILIANLFFWLFQEYSFKKSYIYGLLLLQIAGAIWTAYLFNTFISDGWIFA